MKATSPRSPPQLGGHQHQTCRLSEGAAPGVSEAGNAGAVGSDLCSGLG